MRAGWSTRYVLGHLWRVPPPYGVHHAYTQGLLARSTQAQAGQLLGAVGAQLKAAQEAAQAAKAQRAALLEACRGLEGEVARWGEEGEHVQELDVQPQLDTILAHAEQGVLTVAEAAAAVGRLQESLGQVPAADARAWRPGKGALVVLPRMGGALATVVTPAPDGRRECF